ncbi:MAG: hypothetical protein PVJ81_05200 [Dehalococcoidia bacterium]|jgi:hypothetical protein
MQDYHVINVVGTMCPPEVDEVYNKWYNEKVIPTNMQFKGLLRAARYKLLGPAGGPTNSEYPDYLAIYEFKSFESFEAWNASPEIAASGSDKPELLEKVGIPLLWRAQYSFVESWRNTPPNSFILIVGMKCSPKKEPEFDKWYGGKHLPDVLKFKGIEGATHYKLASSEELAIKTSIKQQVRTYADHMTFFYFKDLSTAEAYDASPERAASLDEVAIKVVKETDASTLWRVRYEPLRTWHK